MKLSLKARLLAWLKRQPDWTPSGNIQRIAAENTTYTPSNVSRRLRELVGENVIEVELRKNHAYYRIKQKQTPEQWFESL